MKNITSSDIGMIVSYEKDLKLDIFLKDQLLSIFASFLSGTNIFEAIQNILSTIHNSGIFEENQRKKSNKSQQENYLMAQYFLLFYRKISNVLIYLFKQIQSELLCRFVFLFQSS